ncbi:MAG TPA: carbamoyltransferase HypF, partial [Thermoanaerobaculia bacterium]|nr:carbamoyltransferase HypF [Thermoanaerobaculia bacterium]
PRTTIPPDLAVCDECLAEVFDPTDRRYRYAFTNCTKCGPRYSIVQGAPYDREKTTMAAFVMCDACRAEYVDPSNRRFHAQPNACPKCGPQLSALTPSGREIDTPDPLAFAARTIRAGMIVAIKGIGGYHLACDATTSLSVQRLRERKRREVKPLAVMVRDLAAAAQLALVSEEEARLLTSVERPIVLLRKRPEAKLAAEVTGDNPLVGIFLPYTPMHHILMREVSKPLVMTSGNVAEEPMVHRDADALKILGDVADVFITHNRAIESRIDDSVVRVIDAVPTVFRRARGYVPRGIPVARAFVEPVLACGAHLKNTFCIGSGNAAFLGPHIGDLETVETLSAYESAIARMKEFTRVEPKLLAHDLHPDYFSTRYALAQDDVRTVGVQHHHAHIASAMAEHQLGGPVIGVAYDGTGYGTDGTAWGGEVLIASFDGFERFATFRPIPLAGGDQAIRQVWRIALALLDEAFDGEPPLHALPLFQAIPRRGIDAVRRMIASRLNAPLARGVGRYFDALGAIALTMPDARYEGEVAFQWNMIAEASERGRYPVVVRDGAQTWEVDFRPVMRAAVEDLVAGRHPAIVSARFHNTLVDVTVELARAALTARGDMPVVLSGGCFQNARLAEGVIAALRSEARVFMNHDVPPGDGGIALGQALVANAFVECGSRAAAVKELVCV